MPPPLGLIAGSGLLPTLLARKAKASGIPLFIAALRGAASPQMEKLGERCTWVSVGQVGTLLSFFRENSVKRAVMHGKVQHAAYFKNLRLDWRALSIWRKAKDRSGESLLKALADELKSEGTRLLDSRFLMADLMPAKGWMTRSPADAAILASVRFGLQQARALAGLAIGQSLLVKKKAIVAVEAMEGTDATILRAGRVAGAGTILIKVPSPRQDWRFDIPTVGLKTVQQLVRAKAQGLVVEAGRTFILEKEKTVKTAEKNGLFILAV